MKHFTSLNILTGLFHIAQYVNVLSSDAQFSTLTDDFFHPRIFPFKHGRRKRYSIEGSFWDVHNITYRISQPSNSMSFWQQKEVFQKAFEVWSKYSKLSFEYRDYGPVHIDILFVRGNHGDGEPFDGKGKILAHAYFPRYGGDLHIDDDEFWSPDKNGPGLDLYSVAVHEIGHSLGLKHSYEINAIMAPFYQTYTGNQLHLHPDDISGLDRLYGNKQTKLAVTEIQDNQLPDFCAKSYVNAVTRAQNGSIYVFQGNYFWELGSDGPMPYYPKQITQFWGVEGPFDAAMTNNQGFTYVFKGSQYWVFTPSMAQMSGYPKEIQKGLQDTPTNLDATFIYHYDNKPYFVKKDKIWPYSRFGMANGYPKSIKTIFNGKAPSHIDAAFRYDQYSTYIFGDDRYWKLSDSKDLRALPGYPRSIAEYWFNCNGIKHIQK